jgi:hypothetical protein
MCDTCDAGYGPKSAADTSCGACAPNCTICTSNGANKCDSGRCSAGYNLDSTNLCKPCNTLTGCTACTIAAAGTVTCTACGNGY